MTQHCIQEHSSGEEEVGVTENPLLDIPPEVEPEEESEPDEELQCPHCPRVFRNQRGLSMHIQRMHKDVEVT